MLETILRTYQRHQEGLSQEVVEQPVEVLQALSSVQIVA